MPAYVETAGHPWASTLGPCTRAAVGDVGMVLGIYAGTTVEELYWQSIMSPYPTRESDLIYMLKPLV